MPGKQTFAVLVDNDVVPVDLRFAREHQLRLAAIAVDEGICGTGHLIDDETAHGEHFETQAGEALLEGLGGVSLRCRCGVGAHGRHIRSGRFSHIVR